MPDSGRPGHRGLDCCRNPNEPARRRRRPDPRHRPRVKLWIRIPDDDYAIHLHFSPRRFQEIAPQLPEIVRTLREAYDAGVSFKVVTEQSLPWGMDWVCYQDDDTSED